jgi:hypothetical protein
MSFLTWTILYFFSLCLSLRGFLAEAISDQPKNITTKDTQNTKGNGFKTLFALRRDTVGEGLDPPVPTNCRSEVSVPSDENPRCVGKVSSPSEGWPVQYLALLTLLAIYPPTFGKVKGDPHKTFRR